MATQFKQEWMAALQGLGATRSTHASTKAKAKPSHPKLHLGVYGINELRGLGMDSVIAQANDAARAAAPVGDANALMLKRFIMSNGQRARAAKMQLEVAKGAMKRGDRRMAAQAALGFALAADEVAFNAASAEKARVQVKLNSIAQRYEQDATYVDGQVQAQVVQTGESATTSKMRTAAGQLRDIAATLRAQAAAYADAQPQKQVSPGRVADVTNKMVVRTSELSRASMSVLNGLADSGLAQAGDYQSALAYYGNDNVGRLAADIEFGRFTAALQGLGCGAGCAAGKAAPALGGLGATSDSGTDCWVPAGTPIYIPFTQIKVGENHTPPQWNADGAWCDCMFANSPDQKKSCKASALPPWTMTAAIVNTVTSIPQSVVSTVTGQGTKALSPLTTYGTKPGTSATNVQTALTNAAASSNSISLPLIGSVNKTVAMVAGGVVLGLSGLAWWALKPSVKSA